VEDASGAAFFILHRAAGEGDRARKRAVEGARRTGKTCVAIAPLPTFLYVDARSFKAGVGRMCWGARRAVISLGVAATAFAALFISTADALAQSFPFGRELVLDANPMRGSKKLPVLDLGDRGTAEIDLWCSSVKAQLIIAANTIITGDKAPRSCAPELARADDDLIDALNQATNWRMEDYALVFTGAAGGRTLRFRIQTN
jgi:hypothetical protein